MWVNIQLMENIYQSYHFKFISQGGQLTWFMQDVLAWALEALSSVLASPSVPGYPLSLKQTGTDGYPIKTLARAFSQILMKSPFNSIYISKSKKLYYQK